MQLYGNDDIPSSEFTLSASSHGVYGRLTRVAVGRGLRAGSPRQAPEVGRAERGPGRAAVIDRPVDRTDEAGRSAVGGAADLMLKGHRYTRLKQSAPGRPFDPDGGGRQGHLQRAVRGRRRTDMPSLVSSHDMDRDRHGATR